MLERYIKRLFFFFFFFKRRLLNFFSYTSEKLKNQVRNELFRQMSLTSTLPLDGTSNGHEKVTGNFFFFFFFFFTENRLDTKSAVFYRKSA